MEEQHNTKPSIASNTIAPNNLQARVEAALINIRQYLKADGGDVKIHSVTADYIVELELLGACSACSMSNMTMKAGIEQAILSAVPEIRGVRAIETNT
jgi:Fe-S cluster biogenesis protein NfuA